MLEDILVKAEDGTDAVEVPVDSPLEGTSQSIGDTATAGEPVDQEAMDEQTLASDGVDLDPEAMSAETEAEPMADPIANEVMEDQSFWTGFFGAPKKPTLG
jgi:hypothetical protein